jgi:hypothetical protein
MFDLLKPHIKHLPTPVGTYQRKPIVDVDPIADLDPHVDECRAPDAVRLLRARRATVAPDLRGVFGGPNADAHQVVSSEDLTSAMVLQQQVVIAVRNSVYPMGRGAREVES